MEIKGWFVKSLNKLACRGEEDSYFCCMLTQKILSDCPVLFVFNTLVYKPLIICMVVIFPFPVTFSQTLFQQPSHLYHRQTLSQTQLLFRPPCVLFAARSRCFVLHLCSDDSERLYLSVCHPACACVSVCTVCDIEPADLSCSVMFTLFLFSVCSLPYPCLLLWCCRAWDIWETKILSLNDWGR